jgi:ABC-type branched-subunit amino acid transport system substrate-binding protein
MYKLIFLLISLVGFAGQAQESVRLGQIVPLSGPLANVGKEIATVTQAAIDQHNKTNRLQIELLSQDDGNDALRSAEAVTALNGKVSGLVSCFGTVGCMAQMKAAQPLGLPLIGPIAGASALRGKQAPFVFAVRASAKEELVKLLSFAQSTGLSQLAVVIQDDGFGQAYWAELKNALVGSGIQIQSFVLLKPSAPDYSDIVTQLNKPTTQALLLLANSTHSVGVLKVWRERNPMPFVMNLSGQANGLFANGLKGYAGAAAFVTVTPSPWEKKFAIQRDYQSAMLDAKITNYSYLGFEAYLNARIAIDAVKRSKNRTPAAIKQTLSSTHFAQGGIELDFGDKAVGRFTDLALLKPDGTFKH